MPASFWMTIGNTVLAWLKVRLNYVFFFAACALLVIWNPLNWVHFTKLDWLIVPHVWIAWLVLLPCSLWLLICFLAFLIQKVKESFARFRFHRLFVKMEPDQASIMMRFISSGNATMTFLEGDAAVYDLEAKGIVIHSLDETPSGLYQSWVDNWTYSLTPKAIAVLRQNRIKKLLGEKAKCLTTQP